jgi:hypothetical protein
VACPYKKRRKIHIIMTVSSENINPSLYRAITNHHGISNLTPYAKNILSTIYNAYSYNNDLNIIFNVRKDDPISPRLLSGILYGVTEYFEKLEIEDSKVSAQININSPGAIIFNIADCFDSIKDMCPYLIGLLIVVGGGSAVSFKVPGAVDIAKKILLLPEDKRKAKAEAEGMELDNLSRKIDLYDKIKSLGINPENLTANIDTIARNAQELDIQPITENDISVAIQETSVVNQPEYEQDDE